MDLEDESRHGHTRDTASSSGVVLNPGQYPLWAAGAGRDEETYTLDLIRRMNGSGDNGVSRTAATGVAHDTCRASRTTISRAATGPPFTPRRYAAGLAVIEAYARAEGEATHRHVSSPNIFPCDSGVRLLPHRVIGGRGSSSERTTSGDLHSGSSGCYQPADRSRQHRHDHRRQPVWNRPCRSRRVDAPDLKRPHDDDRSVPQVGFRPLV